MEGKFHFHQHGNEDEHFYLMGDELLRGVDDQTCALGPGQGFVAPKGLLRRARRRYGAVMAGAADVVPVGDWRAVIFMSTYCYNC